MLAYFAPIGLVVLSNTLYHICAKSTPEKANPFVVLMVTYLVGALCAVLLFLFTGTERNLLKELSKINWAPFALGLAIVGLEVGNIYIYRVGWQISIASIVQSAVLAIALLMVGIFLYREPLSWNKLVGIVICMVGLAVINLK